jgi:hypothetical protein
VAGRRNVDGGHAADADQRIESPLAADELPHALAAMGYDRIFFHLELPWLAARFER